MDALTTNVPLEWIQEEMSSHGLPVTGPAKMFRVSCHSLIRGVLIQSCPTGAKNFTNYVFCHVQFSGVIQNIENRCAIRAKF